jgi:hypothetical protein
MPSDVMFLNRVFTLSRLIVGDKKDQVRGGNALSVREAAPAEGQWYP